THSVAPRIRLLRRQSQRSSGEKLPPQPCREPLNRVPKHRSRHVPHVLPQELYFDRAIALADLAEHPPDSLVNEIVWIVQEECRDLQRVVEFAPSDIEIGRDDSQAALPH